MSSAFTKKVYNIESLFVEILGVGSNQVLLNSCEIVWQGFKKYITGQFSFKRTVLVSDYFYIIQQQKQSSKIIKMIPTETLLLQCRINYRGPTTNSILGLVANTTQLSLYKFINPASKDIIDKQLAFKILNSLFYGIKKVIKQHSNVLINLDLLGTINIYDKMFIHEPQLINISHEKIKIKQIISPKKSQRSSIFRSSKKQNRSSNNLNNMSISKWKPNLVNFQKKKMHFQEIHSPTNRYVVPDVRICNDLLAAGTDPLTYDYNISQLINSGPQLLQYQFSRPEPAKIRYPGIIDKFARTMGSPLNSIKVSSSIVVRIGSNYSKWTKNLYLDLQKKRILYTEPEAKIKLNNYQKFTQVANQRQQYQYILNRDTQQSQNFKIIERYRIYHRYQQYLENAIPNNNIAPLTEGTISKIIMNVKSAAIILGKNAKESIQKLINEANLEYYRGYKKSILDYVLKDSNQRYRVGIPLIFNPVKDWGQGDKKVIELCKQTINEIQQSKKLLQQSYLIYPQCILEITHINESIYNLQFFRIKDAEKRPVNVLYFIKKQMNQIMQIKNYLINNWVKKIGVIISQKINLKKQPINKTRQFLNSIHTIMSNILKQLVYNSLTKISNFFKKYHHSLNREPTLLQLTFTQQNNRIVFTDDLNTIFHQEIINIVDKLVQQTRKMPAVECYLKGYVQRTLWGVNDNDKYLQNCKEQLSMIIKTNLIEIEETKIKFKKYEIILKYKQQLNDWSKINHNINQITDKLIQINNLQALIEQIPFYVIHTLAIIQCSEIKKKLINTIKMMRLQIYQIMQQKIKKINTKIYNQLEKCIISISREISTTKDYVLMFLTLEKIKNNDMPIISIEFQQMKQILLNLCQIGYGYTSFDMLTQVYNTYKKYLGMNEKIKYHENRINNQKIELQKILKQKIKNFENISLIYYKQVSQNVSSYQVRRLHQDYKNKLEQYKLKLIQFKKKIQDLNKDQEYLKWNLTIFESVQQLQSIVDPNYQLWNLVGNFDQLMRDWRGIQLSCMDIDDCEKKIKDIDDSLGKILKKLKNFNGLKIGHQLNNDVRQVIHQQLQIIRIFSHPGLKDRHWHLFNKKMMIPGYDLKQIPYGKIRMLYQYEKNLKVLMSISNQAAKQFDIENQKNKMQEYWTKLIIETNGAEDYVHMKIQQNFIDHNLEIFNQQILRTGLLKNSPFSKVLTQVLSQWQAWLLSGEKILQGLAKSQRKYQQIRYIFNNEEVQKYIPLENTQFETVQGIWKSVLKRISQQPRFIDFCKNLKVLDLLQQIIKKIEFIKNGLSVYLNLKRIQFPKLFLVADETLIHLFTLLNQPNKQSSLIDYLSRLCFHGNIICDESMYKAIESSIDKIQFKNILKKGKGKLLMDLKNIEALTKKIIKQQIFSINKDNSNKNDKTLTSLRCAQQINYWAKFTKYISKNQLNQLTVQYQTLIKQQCCKTVQNCKQIIKNSILLSQKIYHYQCLREFMNNNQMNIQTQHQFIYLSKLRYKYNVNLDQIQLQLANKHIFYQYEYLGKQVVGFINFFSSRYFLHIFNALYHMSAIQISSSHNSSNAIKQLASVCGKFFMNLSSSFINNLVKFKKDKNNNYNGSLNSNLYIPTHYLSNCNELYSFLVGTISCGAWISLNINQIKCQKFMCWKCFPNLEQELIRSKQYDISLINKQCRVATCLYIINDHFKNLRDKKTAKNQYFYLGQNQIKINYNTACFLITSKLTTNYEQIPQIYLKSYRNITIILPKLQDQINQLKIINLIKDNQNWVFLNKILILLNIIQVYLKQQYSIGKIIKEFQKYKTLYSNLQQNAWKYLRNILIRYLPQNILNDFKTILITINPNLVMNQFQQTQLLFSSYLNNLSSQVTNPRKPNILIYGDTSFKSAIIQTAFKQNSCLYRYKINLELVQSENSGFNSINYLRKAFSQIEKKFIQKDSKFWIHIDGNLTTYQLQLLENLDYTIEIPEIKVCKYNDKIGHIVESSEIQCLTPSMLVNFSKYYVSASDITLNQIYTQWIDKQSEKLNLKASDIHIIKSLEPIFENIIVMVQNEKIKKSLLQNNYKFSKVVLMRKILNLFDLYISVLNSKQVQILPQFDSQNYIKNSFIYSIYWNIGLGILHQQQLRNFQGYLRSIFKQELELQGQFNDSYLNQQNQWINWESMIEQFQPQKQNKCVYNLWVPTIQNTKIYTMTIKYLQKGYPVTLYGDICGKSTLIRQISNFEISSHTFVIDCNRYTTSNNVNKTIKNKIVYSQYSHNLIIIDDLYLPIGKVQQIIRCVIDKKSIANISLIGQIQQNLKNVNALISINSQCLNRTFQFKRLLNKTQIISMPTFNERELESIFKSYLSHTFLKYEFNELIIKQQSTIMCVLFKIFKNSQKLLSYHQMRIIIQGICKLNPKKIVDKNSLYTHIFSQLYQLGNKIIDQDLKINYYHFLYDQSIKILSGAFKTYNQFIHKNDNYLYIDIDGIGDIIEPLTKNLDYFRNLFQDILQKKGQKYLYCTIYHTKLIIKILHLFKTSSTHCLILGNRNSGKKTLLRMATTINGLAYVQLGTIKKQQFIKEVLNTIKTGGKIDECICILPDNQNIQYQFLPILNNLISSLEFNELFSDIQMEQVIKSLNSDKKFIKKDVKKSQLIKKVKQKVNSIFHCAISCSNNSFIKNLQTQYPNILKYSTGININQWPRQSYIYVGQKIVTVQQKLRVVENIIDLQTELINNTKKDNISFEWYSTQCFQLFNTFNMLYSEYQKRQKNTAENVQVWAQKIKQNQQKIAQCLKQQKLICCQMKKIKQEIQKIEDSINKKSIQLSEKKQSCNESQEKYDKLKNRRQVEEKKMYQIKSDLEEKLKYIEKKINQEVCQNFRNQICQQLIKKDQRIRAIFDIIVEVHHSLVPNYNSIQEIVVNIQSIKQNCNLEKIVQYEQYNQYLKNILQKSQLILLSENNEDNSIDSQSQIRERLQFYLINWFKVLIKSVEQISSIKQILKQSCQGYQQTEVNYFIQINKYREIQDQIQQLNEGLEQQNNQYQRVQDDYEQLKIKTKQFENIANILKKFQGILRCKNQHIKLCNYDVIPSIIGYVIYMRYGWNLQVRSKIQEILKKNILFKQDTVEFLINFEERIKFKYLYEENLLENYLNFLTINLSDLYSICIDEEDLLPNWIRKVFPNRQIRLLTTDNIQEIKDSLNHGHIVLMKNLTKHSLIKIQNIIDRKIQIKNNVPLLEFDNLQVMIHNHAKIILVYSNNKLIPSQLKTSENSIFATNFSLECLRSKITKIYIEKLTNYPCIDKIVIQYLNKINEVTSIDQKMHGVIQKMKKNTNQIQFIFKKIQDISNSKFSIEKDINKYRSIITQRYSTIKQNSTSVKFIEDVLQLYLNKYRSWKLNDFMEIFIGIILYSGNNQNQIIQNLKKIYLISATENKDQSSNLAAKQPIKSSIVKNLANQYNLIKDKLDKFYSQINDSQFLDGIQLILKLTINSQILVLINNEKNNDYIGQYFEQNQNIFNQQLQFRKPNQLTNLTPQSIVFIEVSLQSDWNQLQNNIQILKIKNIKNKIIIYLPSPSIHRPYWLTNCIEIKIKDMKDQIFAKKWKKDKQKYPISYNRQANDSKRALQRSIQFEKCWLEVSKNKDYYDELLEYNKDGIL